jgi:hypothetical protein
MSRESKTRVSGLNSGYKLVPVTIVHSGIVRDCAFRKFVRIDLIGFFGRLACPAGISLYVAKVESPLANSRIRK